MLFRNIDDFLVHGDIFGAELRHSSIRADKSVRGCADMGHDMKVDEPAVQYGPDAALLGRLGFLEKQDAVRLCAVSQSCCPDQLASFFHHFIIRDDVAAFD